MRWSDLKDKLAHLHPSAHERVLADILHLKIVGGIYVRELVDLKADVKRLKEEQSKACAKKKSTKKSK